MPDASKNSSPRRTPLSKAAPPVVRVDGVDSHVGVSFHRTGTKLSSISTQSIPTRVASRDTPRFLSKEVADEEVRALARLGDDAALRAVDPGRVHEGALGVAGARAAAAATSTIGSSRSTGSRSLPTFHLATPGTILRRVDGTAESIGSCRPVARRRRHRHTCQRPSDAGDAGSKRARATGAKTLPGSARTTGSPHYRIGKRSGRTRARRRPARMPA